MKNKTESNENNQDIQKLGELINDIDIAMLTTIDNDGSLRSRPMGTQEIEFDGDLWFFTSADAAKVHETRQHQQVNVSYADPKAQSYVSVSGHAQLVRDQQKMKELWSPIYKAWFPDGLDDPNLALLRVQVDKAEYWESANGMVVQLVGFAKALVTGEQYQGGENAKVNLKGR